ncbi:hypothetical protein ACHAW6_001640 [Cyclotella cf. meneghiniana]
MALPVNAGPVAGVHIRCSALAPAVWNLTRRHATVPHALILTQPIVLVQIAPPSTLLFAGAPLVPVHILPTVIVSSACRGLSTNDVLVHVNDQMKICHGYWYLFA